MAMESPLFRAASRAADHDTRFMFAWAVGVAQHEMRMYRAAKRREKDLMPDTTIPPVGRMDVATRHKEAAYAIMAPFRHAFQETAASIRDTLGDTRIELVRHAPR